MQPLTLDDLLPLQEYAGRRREFFDTLGRYLDRYRRVRVGPKVTLLFENRQTLWFRVHEIIRIARLSEPDQLQQELDWYNSLLPARDQLQAVMIIDVADETKLTEELAAWQEFSGEHLQLDIGEIAVPATIVTCRPEDRCIGATHWVQFTCDVRARELLATPTEPAYLRFHFKPYQYQSTLLSDDIRDSLLEDLRMSDKDAA